MSDDRFRTWLTAAIEQAEKSWSEGGIPIGSVLVSPDGEIVARGHNERVQTGDPTALRGDGAISTSLPSSRH